MTNSSGFGQTEEQRVKDAANYARTSNDVRTSTEANKYLTAAADVSRSAPVRYQSRTESDPARPGIITEDQPISVRTLADQPGGPGSMTSETDDLRSTYLPDQSFGEI